MKIKLMALGSHPRVAKRLKGESKAGVKPELDVMGMGIRWLNYLKKANLLKEVDWKSLGIKDEDIVEPVHAVYHRTNIRGVTYNTNLVKASEAPRKFEDLLDPKWKGKIIAPGYPTAFPYIALVMGESQALDLVKHLLEDQKMAFARTYNDMRSRVVNGEFLIGYGMEAGKDKKKGAPIQNAPMKVGAFKFLCAVLKDAPHPAAAKLLVHYFTTVPEGTKLLYEITTWGKHTVPGTDAYELAQKYGMVFSKDIADEVWWETTERTKISKKFKKIMGF
jgi:iron(III) transport system substrate-binding protein